MLSVIIPCYNGRVHILDGNIDKVNEYVKMLGIKYEIIVVNDGSTDNSLKILQEKYLNHRDIHIESYENNQGKGYAIKHGMSKASGDVLFMDIDLATDLSAINSILELKDTADIIIGDRYISGSSGGREKSFLRNSMSLVSNLCVRIFTGVNFKDTQCGFKYISHKHVQLIMSKQKINRWAFDVEWLYIAKKHGLIVKEIPVNWHNGEDSVVKPFKASFAFLKGLFFIAFNRKSYL